MHGADLSEGRDIGPVLGGSEAAHYFPLFALRAKDFASGRILNTLQGLPKSMDVMSNYRTELAVIRDPEFGSMDEEVGHVNGTLPAGSIGGYGIAESLLQGIDENGDVISLLTEQPEALPLSVEDAYSATDMGTLEANFVLKQTVSGKKLGTFFMAANKPERIDLTKIYDLVREAITTEYDSKFDFPIANEKYEIASIAGDGTLTLGRKHTLEIGFRFVIGLTTYYIVATPGVSTIRVSTSRGGAVFTNFAGAGITPGDFGTAFYDLVIDQAIASRARPIDQGAVVFAARRVDDALLTLSLGEKDAQWMRLYNCTTTNTYNVVSPAPETRVFLNYGLR